MPKIKIRDPTAPDRTETIEITRWQRFVLFVSKKSFLYWEQRRGNPGALPIYIAKCSTCKKFFLNYPQGHHEFLYCPAHDTKRNNVINKPLVGR